MLPEHSVKSLTEKISDFKFVLSMPTVYYGMQQMLGRGTVLKFGNDLQTRLLVHKLCVTNYSAKLEGKGKTLRRMFSDPDRLSTLRLNFGAISY